MTDANFPYRRTKNQDDDESEDKHGRTDSAVQQWIENWLSYRHLYGMRPNTERSFVLPSFRPQDGQLYLLTGQKLVHRCRVLSLSDCTYSLNQLNQTWID